jgi:hypothetical protein
VVWVPACLFLFQGNKMKISYTKEQRSIAKTHDLRLITIDTPGIAWQGPVPKEVSARLVQWLKDNIIEPSTRSRNSK